MISHVTRAGAGFSTTVVLENSGISELAFRLVPYDTEGTALTPYDGVLAGGQVSLTPVTELFAEGAMVSHFEIEADDALAVSVSYDFESGNGAPAQVGATSAQATGWRLFPGNWNIIFDGVAVVNRGQEATDVWVSQRDLDGNYIKAVRLSQQLAPNAKALFVIGEPNGSAFDDEIESYFEVSANQKLAITALRGTLGREDIGLLWANQARGVSLSESRRDELGIWFITGGTLFDVFEMMGYNVAVDRLWQADLFRRNGLGRLAEFFGDDFLTPDRVTRAISYTAEEMAQMFADLDPESRTMIQAYSDGMNRRIAQVNSNIELLPYEYQFLGLTQVEPWHYTHVLAWLAALQRSFSLDNLGTGQLDNASRLQTLLQFTGGDQAQTGQMFNEFYWSNDANAPTMIPATPEQKRRAAAKAPPPIPIVDPNAPDMRGVASSFRNMLEENKKLLSSVGALAKGGSYAWVVSGEKTDTGNPMLFSGPQVDYTAPGMVCEGSIESDAITVSGMVIPGIPAVVIGRTPHHAWSFQVGHTNSWDFYLEPQSAITENREEIILVRNMETGELRQEPATLSRTVHGPIVNRAPLLSWKYSAWGREFNLGQGFLKMARATNPDGFGEGVANLGASLHVCYADKDGNIAYWLSGRTPVRPSGDYRFPQGFLGAQLEYDADVVEPMPHDRNHPQGWYAGWNTKASVDFEDLTGTFHFGKFHRTHVIQEFFQSHDTVTAEDLLALERSVVHTFSIAAGGDPWTYMEPTFRPVVEANPTPERMAAMEMFDGWDGLFTDFQIPETDVLPVWVLVRDWLFGAMDLAFADELGPSGANPGPGIPGDLLTGLHWANALFHGLDPDTGVAHEYDWFSNLDDPEAPQTGEAIILQALDQAILVNGSALRNLITFDHPFLGLLHGPNFLNRSIYSQLVELGPEGPVRILSLFGIGQSGNVQSSVEGEAIYDPNFFSLTEDYDSFNYREFPLFQ